MDVMVTIMGVVKNVAEDDVLRLQKMGKDDLATLLVRNGVDIQLEVKEA
jgi:hypothetical protein